MQSRTIFSRNYVNTNPGIGSGGCKDDPVKLTPLACIEVIVGRVTPSWVTKKPGDQHMLPAVIQTSLMAANSWEVVRTGTPGETEDCSVAFKFPMQQIPSFAKII